MHLKFWENKMKISVPATSANLGAGFDSMGIALNLYLEIEVFEAQENWQIEHDLGVEIPADEQNLLIQTAQKVFDAFDHSVKTLTAHKIKMTSQIPLARGLGSSSSVIVAGIELANQLGELHLTSEEKLQIATKIEGHPDNVAPALFGNLVIASTVDGVTKAISADFPACKLLAFVPNYELKTTESRHVLPAQLSYQEAVAASSLANVLAASLLTGDLVLAGQMIERDLFHEKYRKKLVPELARLRKIGHENQAFATYLSGAGPTIMFLSDETHLTELSKRILDEKLDGKLYFLEIDQTGMRVEH